MFLSWLIRFKHLKDLQLKNHKNQKLTRQKWWTTQNVTYNLDKRNSWNFWKEHIIAIWYKNQKQLQIQLVDN